MTTPALFILSITIAGIILAEVITQWDIKNREEFFASQDKKKRDAKEKRDGD